MGLPIPTWSDMLHVAEGRGQASEDPELWKGLDFYAPLAEKGGLIAHDLMRKRTGTLTDMDPATDWVMEENLRALDFDGGDDGVMFGNDIGNFGTNDFTIAFWFYDKDTWNWDSLLSKGEVNTANEWWISAFDNLGTRSLLFSGNADGSVVTGAYTANMWVHYAITRIGDQYKAYLNGVLNTTTNTMSGDPIADLDNAHLFTFGAFEDFTRTWAGKLSDVGLWHRGLIPSEITKLYKRKYALVQLKKIPLRKRFTTFWKTVAHSIKIKRDPVGQKPSVGTSVGIATEATGVLPNVATELTITSSIDSPHVRSVDHKLYITQTVDPRSFLKSVTHYVTITPVIDSSESVIEVQHVSHTLTVTQAITKNRDINKSVAHTVTIISGSWGYTEELIW